MGNAPLPKPPVPTSNRAVIPITTRKKSVWDTELQLLSPALLLTTANSLHQAQIDNPAGQVSDSDNHGSNIDEDDHYGIQNTRKIVVHFSVRVTAFQSTQEITCNQLKRFCQSLYADQTLFVENTSILNLLHY